MHWRITRHQLKGINFAAVPRTQTSGNLPPSKHQVCNDSLEIELLLQSLSLCTLDIEYPSKTVWPLSASFRYRYFGGVMSTSVNFFLQLLLRRNISVVLRK